MNSNDNPMGTKPVFPLLMSMSLPPIVSMMIQSLYNIVDSIFVARISQDAVTAVSLVFPLQNLLLAVAVGMGIGVNACIAIGLGAKRQEEADSAATHGFVLTALHAVLFILVGIFVTRPFLQMFTDDAAILHMGSQYGHVVLCLSFGMLFQIYIEKLFQATGDMVIPMLIQGVGAVMNIILDPIMIFGLFGMPAMGVAGAAVATVCGQITGCLVSVIFFRRRHLGIHVKLRGFHLDGSMVKHLYGIAIPSGVMMGLPSILVGTLNVILSGLSEFGVAVFGIYFKIQTFIYMPIGGVMQGMRPIMSYNYGAKNRERMREILKCTLKVAVAILFVGTLLFWVFPKPIMSLFDVEGEMLILSVRCMRIISTGFMISGVGMVFSGVFESLGKGPRSLAISLTRQLIVIPPLAFALSREWGINGVWLAFPAAECLAALVAFVLYKKTPELR